MKLLQVGTGQPGVIVGVRLKPVGLRIGADLQSSLVHAGAPNPGLFDGVICVSCKDAGLSVGAVFAVICDAADKQFHAIAFIMMTFAILRP